MKRVRIAEQKAMTPSIQKQPRKLNRAACSDDGNPLLRNRAVKALEQWMGLLGSIIKTGITACEIRNEVEPDDVAAIIISSVEGALMMGRLQRNRDALRTVRSHLENYLESQVRRLPAKRRTS